MSPAKAVPRCTPMLSVRPTGSASTRRAAATSRSSSSSVWWGTPATISALAPPATTSVPTQQTSSSTQAAPRTSLTRFRRSWPDDRGEPIEAPDAHEGDHHLPVLAGASPARSRARRAAGTCRSGAPSSAPTSPSTPAAAAAAERFPRSSAAARRRAAPRPGGPGRWPAPPAPRRPWPALRARRCGSRPVRRGTAGRCGPSPIDDLGGAGRDADRHGQADVAGGGGDPARLLEHRCMVVAASTARAAWPVPVKATNSASPAEEQDVAAERGQGIDQSGEARRRWRR